MLLHRCIGNLLVWSTAYIWKLRERSFGKLVSSILMQKPLLEYQGDSYPTIGRYFERNGCLLYGAGLMYSTKAAVSEAARRARKTCLTEAQIALLDYLHNTRGLSYIDAEHLCKTHRIFLKHFCRRWMISRKLGSR